MKQPTIQRISTLLLLLCLTIGTVHAQKNKLRKELSNQLELIAGSELSFMKGRMPLTANNEQIDRATMHAELFQILQQEGWLSKPAVSEQASSAYYLVLFNSPFAVQEQWRDSIEMAHQRQYITDHQYGYLIDPMLVKANKYQFFGTVTRTDPLGNVYTIPVDTTYQKQVKPLTSNQGLPILGTSTDQVCLILHVFADDLKSALDEVEIYLDDQKLGQTNAKGFFQILVPRFEGKKVLKMQLGEQTKKMWLPSHPDQDVFDKYLTFDDIQFSGNFNLEPLEDESN